MLEKSLTLATDNITYDLEDSVTPSQKAAAREALVQHLSALTRSSPHVKPHTASPSFAARELGVRINAVSTPHALADLEAIAPFLSVSSQPFTSDRTPAPPAWPPISALVIPKVSSPSDLRLVADVVASLSRRTVRVPTAPPLHLIALIESARAVTDLREICAVSLPADSGTVLSSLVFAAEDFAADLSVRRTPSLREFLYARSAIATHATAYGLPGGAIDLVCTEFRGEEGLRRLREECEDGKGLGFSGKQVIHPSQLETVLRVFGVADDEMEWAARVVVADEKAAAAGRGAWTMDGKMIDAPVVERARRLLAKAEMCGVDVQGWRERWKDQQPG